MAYDWLKGVADEYDVIVIGSGLGGLTGANVPREGGPPVLLLEHHYQFGGLATWFTRKGGHIFDISLHGFPSGMIKSCRKYWTKEIADSIVQLKDIRFVNPQMDVWTTFTREDYTRVLVEQFKLDAGARGEILRLPAGDEFLRQQPRDDGRDVRALLPGPARCAPPADGADRLRQRLHARTTRRSPTASCFRISWARGSSRSAAAPTC
jgi:phytoene dehydrogenase-like protein